MDVPDGEKDVLMPSRLTTKVSKKHTGVIFTSIFLHKVDVFCVILQPVFRIRAIARTWKQFFY